MERFEPHTAKSTHQIKISDDNVHTYGIRVNFGEEVFVEATSSYININITQPGTPTVKAYDEFGEYLGHSDSMQVTP